MIYDDIVMNFIRVVENIKRETNIIIEIKMNAYMYDEYGNKDSNIYDNVIINLPKIDNPYKSSEYRKEGKK